MIKFSIYSILAFLIFILLILGIVYLNIYLYKQINSHVIFGMILINILIFFAFVFFCAIFDIKYPFKVFEKIDKFCKKERKIKF